MGVLSAEYPVSNLADPSPTLERNFKWLAIQ